VSCFTTASFLSKFIVFAVDTNGTLARYGLAATDQDAAERGAAIFGVAAPGN
jgi:hypothetical protein